LAAESARHLAWEGCFNVRDLGGHPTRDGGSTRFGVVVRSDSPRRLTESGWAALSEYGVRTIVDLRDPVELQDDPPRRLELEHVHVPVLDFSDTAFWDGWRGRYDALGFYREVLERWPRRFAEAVSAVAGADDGCVLVHCLVGRDRTGLVSALVLSVAGVPPEAIAADYALSAERLAPLYEQWIAEAADPRQRARLERENVAEASAMLALLDGLDAEAYLREAGVTGAELESLRERLRG
jgi:protein tyrosine/serine phosphatase